MTLFWKTRDRPGRDFKHLLSWAAFLGQLAKRKLHPLQGMILCLWFFPLEFYEGGICFFGNLTGQSWWGNMQVINRGRGVCSFSFGSYVKSPTVQVLKIQDAPLLRVAQAPYFIVSYAKEKAPMGESEEMENQGENIRCVEEGTHRPIHNKRLLFWKVWGWL